GRICFPQTRIQEFTGLAQNQIGHALALVGLFQTEVNQSLVMLSNLLLDALIELKEVVGGKRSEKLLGEILQRLAALRRNWLSRPEKPAFSSHGKTAHLLGHAFQALPAVLEFLQIIRSVLDHALINGNQRLHQEILKPSVAKVAQLLNDVSANRNLPRASVLGV